MIKFSLATLLFLVALLGEAQRYQYTSFSVADGLTDPFIYDMAETNNGYLLIGTGEGLAKYDGKTILTYTANDGLNNSLITCIEHDSLSNTAYLGHNDGSISSYCHGEITAFDKDSAFTSKIQAIKVHPNGTIWALSQSQGFITYNSSGQIKSIIPMPVEDIIVYDFAFYLDHILITTSEGLFINSIDKKLSESSITKLETDLSWSTFFLDKDKNELYGASDMGIYSILKLGDEFVARQIIEYESGASTSFFKSRNSFIIASREGVDKYSIPSGNKYVLTESYNERNGLPTNFVSSVYEDNFGNSWFGTYGEGLHLLVDQFFTFYNQEEPDAVNNTTCVYIGDSAKYFGVGNQLNVINTYKIPPYNILYTESGLPNDRFSSVIESKGIWVGSKNNGLYHANSISDSFKKVQLSNEQLSDYVYDITEHNNKIWVASEAGVFVVNTETHTVDTSYNTSNGLRHNKVYGFLVDHDTIWMATISNYLTGVADHAIVERKLEVGNNLLSVITLQKDYLGNIWLATLNNGVLKLSQNNEITSYSSNDGLLSDHCYALSIADDNHVWVGHRYGFSRIRDNGEITIYDANDGIDGEINLNAMHKDSLGNIWMGTSEGLIKYNPNADIERSNVPFVDLISIEIDGKNYRDQYSFVLPYAKHEITFSFKGISLSNSDDIYFMYLLEGHDDNWTTTREGQVKFSNIRNGDYTFRVRVCNGAGECREYKSKVNILVDDPFWMKWWFIASVGVLVIALVIIIIRVRTNSLRKAQKELERQLALRTKQIVEQKEIIEEKNKDITDSINYAKRIQTTMLPELDELRAKIDGVFVYYRPRDIVSGDFYWYKQYDDRLIFVVADCTGHGVPGAFMSLIGGVALKHICSDTEDLPASVIMTNLNKEVAEILKQNISDEDDYTALRDGMDILIAEYKINSNELSVSSAKRPYFVKQNNILKRYNGDRMSIGGGIKKQDFTQETFKMTSGDAIYMFSDGYTDQFGGPDYKKIQLKGVFDLIQGNLDLNVDDMHQLIGSHFESWLGKEEQIDDVLFMGIHF